MTLSHISGKQTMADDRPTIRDSAATIRSMVSVRLVLCHQESKQVGVLRPVNRYGYMRAITRKRKETRKR